jgi:sporulation-control protein
MFKKILSSIGIGAAKIDLVLHQSATTTGGKLEGEIQLKGGEAAQELGEILVELEVRSGYVHDDRTINVHEILYRTVLQDATTISPGEHRVVPVVIEIPKNIPVTSLFTKYSLKTNLDIKQGLDAGDRDYIQILPSGILKNFMDAMKELGFQPKGEAFNGQYQIIDFRPTQWLAGQLDELVFSYRTAMSDRELSGSFEIDKRGSGFGGWLADELDLDEAKGRYRFTADQLSTSARAKSTIQSFIQTHLDRLM